MPLTDWIASPSSTGYIVGLNNVWVQLVAKTDGTAYTATAATVNGMWTINPTPTPGIYEIWVAPSVGGPWTDTGETYEVFGSGYVDLVTSQTVGGTKTFTNRPVLPNDYVDTANAQTVSGIKTFNNRPVLPGDYVDLSSNQTVLGSKVFGNPVAVSTPGATDGGSFGGGKNSGPPTAGTWPYGATVVDPVTKCLWVCTVAGGPGVMQWTQIPPAGTTPGMVKLDHVTLTSATSCAHGGISNAYSHLQLRVRLSGAATNGTVLALQFNTDSGNNYVWEEIYGSGNGFNYINGGITNYIRLTSVGSFGGSAIADIFGYTDPVGDTKTTHIHGGRYDSGSFGVTETVWGLWSQTAVITRVFWSVLAGGGAVTGTSELYGIV